MVSHPRMYIPITNLETSPHNLENCVQSAVGTQHGGNCVARGVSACMRAVNLAWGRDWDTGMRVLVIASMQC